MREPYAEMQGKARVWYRESYRFKGFWLPAVEIGYPGQRIGERDAVAEDGIVLQATWMNYSLFYMQHIAHVK